MDEEEWLECQEPNSMVRFLEGKVTERKLRLFAAACCRTIIHLLDDERSRKAVEVAEQYAEGRATRRQLEAAAQDVANYAPRARGPAARKAAVAAANAAAVTTDDYGSTCLYYVTREAARAAARDPGKGPTGLAAWDAATVTERIGQASLLRDRFGPLPFRPVALDPAWLTPSVANVAQVAYEERELPSGYLDTGRLAVLADCLEEVGCDNADILGHLRSAGPHVRGCWPLDLLLGKE